MKKTVFIFLVLCVSQLFSQTDLKDFFKLSGPIKTWVVFHSFKAKKAFKISLETNKVSDSIRKTNLLDGDAAGGQVDAFRHAYWMARLRQELGKSTARSLGKAHEKDNYKTYKKRKLEDGVVQDKISSKMDLHNNDEGLKLIKKRSKISRISLIYKIVNAIKEGKMKIIKKNKKGVFLTCEGEIIPQKELKGKWKNNKCLVASNEIM